MKRFIAFYNSSNSGIQTKDKAIEWATNQMSKTPNISEVHLCEVVNVVERTVPTVVVKDFFVKLDEPVAKAA